ncbi:DUF2933 domain-containing protein [Ancylobacter dichloromethanicus]|uniref:DUF2933 domain-containing protein n=2 Tax=Xanthobacteraceae TaxID=335928 RepID=A0A9W6J3R0_9HYPH|nr:hypothetical protein GCM10017643_03760 [Ancylobacter dichloromethanicus]
MAGHGSSAVVSLGGWRLADASLHRLATSGRLQGVPVRPGLTWVEFPMEHGGHGGEGGFFRSRANWVLIGFLAIGGFYLLTEHRAHLIPYLGYWPFLLILACPLMHVFMHGGHGGHGGRGGSNDSGSGSADAGQNQPHKH